MGPPVPSFVSDMSPYERAAEMYTEEGMAAFVALVDFHLCHGFVYSAPEYFVMGRPVVMEAEADLICEPTHLFPEHLCNCWYIHAMAGKLEKVWDILPRQYPWIAWQRLHDPQKGLRIYPLPRMRAMSIHNDASTY